MNLPFFLIVMALLGVGYFWVGIRLSRGLQSRSDYFLGGRTIGRVALALSIMATQLGGGVVLGAADEGYRLGWAALFWPGGIALGLLALGLGLGKRLRQMEVSTVAELFSSVYGSRPLRWLASALSMVSLFLLLVAQLIACRKLLLAFGVESDLLFILLWVGVLFYTVAGGLKAVVTTDVIQSLFLLFVFLLAFGAAWVASPSVEVGAPAFGSVGGGWSLSSTLFLMPFLFMLIGQDMGQRCFAAQSDRAVSTAFLIAVVGFSMVGAVPVAFGVWARCAGIEVEGGASVLMVAASAMTNPIVATLVGCGALVAILSTVDSLLCAVSSNLASDFTDRVGLRLCQLSTLGLGVLAILLSMACKSVSEITMLSYKISVACLAVPVLASLWRRQATPLAGLLSVACGGFGLLVLGSEVGALLLSGAGYGVGLKFGRKVEMRSVG